VPTVLDPIYLTVTEEGVSGYAAQTIIVISMFAEMTEFADVLLSLGEDYIGEFRLKAVYSDFTEFYVQASDVVGLTYDYYGYSVTTSPLSGDTMQIHVVGATTTGNLPFSIQISGVYVDGEFVPAGSILSGQTPRIYWES
jgi:hypothetical protein